jgi:hypothetical protein
MAVELMDEALGFVPGKKGRPAKDWIIKPELLDSFGELKPGSKVWSFKRSKELGVSNKTLQRRRRKEKRQRPLPLPRRRRRRTPRH